VHAADGEGDLIDVGGELVVCEARLGLSDQFRPMQGGPEHRVGDAASRQPRMYAVAMFAGSGSPTANRWATGFIRQKRPCQLG
jgi:hypothetical protein